MADSRRVDPFARLRLRPFDPNRAAGSLSVAFSRFALMADDAPERLLLIVTGSTLRAEEVDRPLAYYLKQRVDHGLALLPIEPIATRVIADFRWLNESQLQGLPTVSVGGPGVNALAGQLYDQLPFALAVDEHYCIQMDPEVADLRVSIWGMDNPKTQIAVGIFVDRYLARFLDGCSRHSFDSPAFLPDPEPDDEDDDESEI